MQKNLQQHNITPAWTLILFWSDFIVSDNSGVFGCLQYAGLCHPGRCSHPDARRAFNGSPPCLSYWLGFQTRFIWKYVINWKGLKWQQQRNWIACFEPLFDAWKQYRIYREGGPHATERNHVLIRSLTELQPTTRNAFLDSPHFEAPRRSQRHFANVQNLQYFNPPKKSPNICVTIDLTWGGIWRIHWIRKNFLSEVHFMAAWLRARSSHFVVSYIRISIFSAGRQ